MQHVVIGPGGTAPLGAAGLASVVVKKDVLLTKLHAFREAHVLAYGLTMAGYRASFVRAYRNACDHIEEYQEMPRIPSLPQPENHTADYDAVIAMLEMSSKREVELTKEEVAHYVLDNWPWMPAFHALRARYLRD